MIREKTETHRFALTANGEPINGRTYRERKHAEHVAASYNRRTQRGDDPLPGIGSGLAFGVSDIEPVKARVGYLAL